MWILPTRSRVKNCQRLISAFAATDTASPIYVRLDDNDPELEQMADLPWPDYCEIVIGPQVRMRAAMEEMLGRYPAEPWYGILADDAIPRTFQWDQRLISAASPADISYGDEVWEKKNRICFPCVGGDLVRFVGFFGVPGVEHWGTDTLWERLHHECGRNNKQADVVLEHAHFNFGQAPLDETYAGTQQLKKQDKRAYRAWMDANFEDLKQRVTAHFGWAQ